MSRNQLMCYNCGDRPYINDDKLCQECIDEIKRKSIPFTYRNLKEKILDLPEERLDDEVAIFDDAVNEFYKIGSFQISTNENTFDIGHAYLSYEKE